MQPDAKSIVLTIGALALLHTGSARAAPGLPASAYDADLCVTAQRLLVNAPAMPVRVQRGQGNGFHTIQMSIDEARRELVVAMTTSGEAVPLAVACKMVNRDRANDQLQLALDGPRRSCRDVNEHTYQVAWALLTDAQRERYATRGRTLHFTADTIVATGGEWLPAAPSAYIRASRDAAVVEVSAPSVQVPWDDRERGFFQGTHHCKLISLAAMRRWMTAAAFEPDGTLLPTAEVACAAPSTATARAGSCVFYFAPADAMFCTDFSGAGWTDARARAECAKRHASRTALQAADNRYEGAGGIFSASGCADRADAPDIAGTCVFHCNQPDEVLWQVAGGPNAMMNRACDLYIERDP